MAARASATFGPTLMPRLIQEALCRDHPSGSQVLGLAVRRHRDPFDEQTRLRIFLDARRVKGFLEEIDGWADGLDADRPLGAQFRGFNQRLRGWFESCQYADDAGQAFETLDRRVGTAVRRRLKQLLGCSGDALHQRHRLRLPSGHETWQADGEALLVLSSLPRKRYRPRRQRPAWEPSLPPAEHAAAPAVPAPGRVLPPAAARSAGGPP